MVCGYVKIAFIIFKYMFLFCSCCIYFNYFIYYSDFSLIAFHGKHPLLSCYILYHGSREHEVKNKEFHYVKDTKNIFSQNPLFPCLGAIETNATNSDGLEKIVKRILSLNIISA